MCIQTVINSLAMGGGGAPAGTSRGLPKLPNNHLSYAVIWFSLGLSDVIMFALYTRETPKS